MSLGIENERNFLVPHDASWAAQFEQERARIKAAIGAQAIDIQHIGSTAIPNIQAKPIIDIAIAALSASVADSWQVAMAAIGYDYPGDIGIPEHRIYGRDLTQRRFLVHVVTADGERWHNFLNFRDLLRSNHLLAQTYESQKQTAAAKHPTDRAKYTQAKESFISAALST